MANISRPTSPHLGVYRWSMTMLLSILHRATGVALYVGTVVLLAFLFTVAYAPAQYGDFHELLGTPLARVLFIGWTLAFFIHFFNGIRHLFWDIGKGFEKKLASRNSWLVLVLAIFCTASIWCALLQPVAEGM